MQWLAGVVGVGIGLVLVLASFAGLVRVMRYQRALHRFKTTGRCSHRYTWIAPVPFPDVSPAGVWCRICGELVRER